MVKLCISKATMLKLERSCQLPLHKEKCAFYIFKQKLLYVLTQRILHFYLLIT